jgi:hypothetical protein
MRILPGNISFNSQNVLRYSSMASLLISWLVTMPILSALPGASLLFWGSRILSLYTVYDMGLRISLKDCIEKLQTLGTNLLGSSNKIQNSTDSLNQVVDRLKPVLKEEEMATQQFAVVTDSMSDAAQAQNNAASNLRDALNALEEGRSVKERATQVNSEFERLAAELMKELVSP